MEIFGLADSLKRRRFWRKIGVIGEELMLMNVKVKNKIAVVIVCIAARCEKYVLKHKKMGKKINLEDWEKGYNFALAFGNEGSTNESKGH